MTADNDFVCYVNGRQVGTGDNFKQAYVMDVASALKPGENLIAVAATNTTDNPSPAGLIGLLSIKLSDGRTIEVPTDPSWETLRESRRGLELQREAGAKAGPRPCSLGRWAWRPGATSEPCPPVEEVFPAATVVHQWLAKEGVPPDFRADRPLRYIHRRIGEADVYFVANGSTEGLRGDLLVPRCRQAAGTVAPRERQRRAAAGLRREGRLHARAAAAGADGIGVHRLPAPGRSGQSHGVRHA